MSILTDAETIINGQRARDYGDAKENHQRIAALWSAYKPGTVFSPEDVAVMMILLKIARFMENGYHHDTVVDIAGYAGVLEKMQLPDKERYPEDEPRVWDHIVQVPRGTVVADKHGDHFKWKKNGELWFRYRETDNFVPWGRIDPVFSLSYGPFTEVKESK